MSKKKWVVLLMAGVVGAACFSSAASWAAGHHAEAEHEEQGSAAVTHHREATAKDADGNAICPVTGEKVADMEKVTIRHDGRTVNLCCQYCVGEYKKHPEKYQK